MQKFFSYTGGSTIEVMNDSNVTERVRRYWVDRKMGNMKIVGFLQFVLVGKKYDDFIFYLFPFYHVLLPSINKLIVLDFDTGKHIGHYCSTFFKNTFSSKFANVQSKKKSVSFQGRSFIITSRVRQVQRLARAWDGY